MNAISITRSAEGDVYYWGPLMAGCLIASVPVTILDNFFLDRFTAGLTVGAIR
jgi:multiple sugar transport system permease protein